MDDHLASVRAAYDTVAPGYADLLADELARRPLDRALLGVFAELAGPGTVGDLGCGPGRISAHLHALGRDVLGVDLSPGMIAEARRRHPGPRFAIGSISALGLADGALAGAVAWYSIIHTPRELVPAMVGEFRRVIVAGGPLLLAFQVGDEVRHITEGYGYRGLALDAYRWDPAEVTAMLTEAGFTVRTTVVREPVGPETVRQAYLIAD